MRQRAARHWIVLACALPILALIALVLAAPLWIDAAAVRAQVERWIGDATGGRARFAAIELHWLPRPGIVLSEPRFAMPGTIDVAAKSAAVDLDILGLLLGSVQPRTVRVASPRIRATLPEPSGDSPAFSLAQAEQRLRAVVDAVVDAAPGADVQVDDGAVEVRLGTRPPFTVDHLSLRFAVVHGVIDAQLDCAAPWWDKLQIALRIARGTLAGEGHAEVVGLSAHRLGELAGIGTPWPLEEATAKLAVALKLNGLTNASADLSLTAPSVVVRIGEGRFDAQDVAAAATARVVNGAFDVTLRQLTVASPRLALSATLSWDERAGFKLGAEAADVDIPTLIDTTRRLAPEAQWLANLPVTIDAGRIASLHLASSGTSFDELVAPASLHATGEIAGVTLGVPAYDLHLHDVAARVRFEQNEIHVEDIAAATEKSTARAGTFGATLGVDPMPLHGEVTVDLDLAEGWSIARRIVTDRAARTQMARVRGLAGSAVVHVAFGDDAQHVRPQIEVSALTATLSHEAIPFPLRITQGRVAFANDTLALSDIEGAVGGTSFRGLGAVLGLTAPFPVREGRGAALVSLGPWFDWARKQSEWSQWSSRIDRVSGQLALSVKQLEGPLQSPADLRFRISATPHQVRLDAPALAPPLAFDGGTVDIEPRAVVVRAVGVSALDLALELGGRVDEYRTGVDHLRTSLQGRLGPRSLDWIARRAGIADQWRLRDALGVTGVDVSWDKAGSIEAHGSLQVHGGPVVEFTAGRSGESIRIDRLALRDEESDATFAGNLEGTRFTMAFKGHLAGSSIVHMFATPPIGLGTLQGDLQLTGDWHRPGHGTGSGTLQGENIRVPVAALADPLVVERFVMNAHEARIAIASATLSSGPSRLKLSGSLDRGGNAFRVDSDVQADTIVIPEAIADPATAASAGVPAPSFEDRLQILERFPVSGEVRFDIGRLRKGGLEVAPLTGSATLDAARLDVRITRAALCSLSLNANATAKPDHVDAVAVIRARDALLDKSIACLTNARVQLTGRIDLDADLSASGPPGTLLDALKGRFSATSRDGRIEKFEALTKIFDLLNVTEAVRGKMPDLKQKGMGYRSAQVNGTVVGRTVNFDQAVLDATGIKIAAQGSVDYSTGKVNVNVLVAPLQTVNWILDNTPILRRIFGGTVLALPVGVHGTVDRPIIVPLGPKAVASRLIDIIANTAKLPADLINTISSESKDAATAPATPPKRKGRAPDEATSIAKTSWERCLSGLRWHSPSRRSRPRAQCASAGTFST